jgi:hypothetical protein
MRILLVSLVSLVVLVAAPVPALADGFAEFAAGIAQPIADDDYDNSFDTHVQFGVRFGSVSTAEAGRGVGFEIGFNYSPLNDEIPIDDLSVHRFRATGGVRAVHPVSESAALVARLAAGIEYVRADWEILGFQDEIDSTGVVIDPGLGFLVGSGGTRFGGFIGVPFAFHDETEGAVSVEYTAVDLDVLFVLSIAL